MLLGCDQSGSLLSLDRDWDRNRTRRRATKNQSSQLAMHHLDRIIARKEVHACSQCYAGERDPVGAVRASLNRARLGVLAKRAVDCDTCGWP